jgi:hypothetical protein
MSPRWSKTTLRATSGHSRTAAEEQAILATIDSINRRRGTIPSHEANNGRREKSRVVQYDWEPL